MKDEIISELHLIRDELAAQHGYDLRRIFEAARKREGESSRYYVTLQPRRIQHSEEKTEPEDKASTR